MYITISIQKSCMYTYDDDDGWRVDSWQNAFFSNETKKKRNNDYDCIAYWVDVIYTLKMPILCNKTDIPNLQPPWTINWIIFFVFCALSANDLRCSKTWGWIYFFFNFITTKWYIMYNWYMCLIRVLSVTWLFSK